MINFVSKSKIKFRIKLCLVNVVGSGTPGLVVYIGSISAAHSSSGILPEKRRLDA